MKVQCSRYSWPIGMINEIRPFPFCMSFSQKKSTKIEVDESSTDKHSWGENFQDPLIHFTPNGISFWWNNIHNKESD